VVVEKKKRGERKEKSGFMKGPGGAER